MNAKTCSEIIKYVRCKIDREVLQSFSDEFEMPSQKYSTPAVAGTVLMPGMKEEWLTAKEATKYRSGVGKLMHLMQYSKPEIYNAV